MKKVTGLLAILPQLVLAQEYWNGIPYPLNRWGVSVMGVNQREKGDLKSASVEGIKIHEKIPDLNAYFLNPHDMEVDAKVQIVKVDYFILPFLNIYAIGGKLEAEAKFNLGRGNINFDSTGKDWNDKLLGAIGSEISKTMPENLHIKQKSEGKLLGGGALIAGEYKRVFSSLQYTYTRIDMDGDVAAKSAEVASGRVGYVVYRDSNFSMTPYLGASYQKTDSEISGVIPSTTLNYKFAMELEDLTPAAGVFTVIKNDFTVLLEYSFGDRKTLAIDLG
ncbi:hypothetical protein, partial [uncultured Cetobacterium sp.]|uniref:hypothetical protein n=1 Tax=uncultured Cetobacterium sp. TaxID=527638 RepID=UPI002623E413